MSHVLKEEERPANEKQPRYMGCKKEGGRLFFNMSGDGWPSSRSSPLGTTSEAAVTTVARAGRVLPA